MNYLNLVKGATDLVVSIGAGAIVTNMVKATTPEDVKRMNKIAIKVGSVVISSMVGSAASKYATKNIDDTVYLFNKTKDEIKNPENTEN